MAAGIFRRCAAFVLDLLLWLLLCFPMRLLLSLLGMAGIGSEAVFFHYTIADLILAAFFALYFIAFEGAFGTTPGKRVCGMRIVSVRTEHLGWLDVVYRETVGRFLNNLLLLGYIFALFDRRHRTFADRLCDTRVVLIRQPVFPQFVSDEGISPPNFAASTEDPASPPENEKMGNSDTVF